MIRLKRIRFLLILLGLSILVVYGVRFSVALGKTKADMDQLEIFKVKNISMVNDSGDGNSLLQAVDLSNHNRLLEFSVRKPKTPQKDVKFVYVYKNEMATVDHQQMKDLRFHEQYDLIFSSGLLLKIIIFVILADIVIISLWAYIILKRQKLRYQKNKHITNE